MERFTAWARDVVGRYRTLAKQKDDMVRSIYTGAEYLRQNSELEKFMILLKFFFRALVEVMIRV
jgi:hypothetical protein